MPKVRNISNGPRGAYADGALRMANPGEVVEADDFAPEWFEAVSDGEPEAELEAEPEQAPDNPPARDPLDHDGDGRKGGSRPGRRRKAAE